MRRILADKGRIKIFKVIKRKITNMLSLDDVTAFVRLSDSRLSLQHEVRRTIHTVTNK